MKTLKALLILLWLGWVCWGAYVYVFPWVQKNYGVEVVAGITMGLWVVLLFYTAGSLCRK